MPKVKHRTVPLQADYVATGVRMETGKKITHLMLHEVNGSFSWSSGQPTTTEEVLQILNTGKLIRTMRWSYVCAKWVPGVLVRATTLVDGSRSIKSASDNVVTDNLEHLIHMHPAV